MRLRRELVILGAGAALTPVVESAAGPFLAVGGASPDLSMVIAALSGLSFGPRTGAAIGFASGIVQDLMVGRYIGTNALVHLALGFAAGLAETRVFKEDLWVPFVAAGVGVLAGDLLTLLMLRALGVAVRFGPVIYRVAAPSALYSALLAPLLYLPILRLRTVFRLRVQREGGA